MPEFLDTYSSGEVAVLLGLITGLVFGVFAQQSRFCLRAAAKITINIPVSVNHNAPFFSMKSPNFLPKRLVK